MSKIKQQSTIKDMILATIEGYIDAQNEKGMKKYGQSIDDCPVGDYDWQQEIIQELIDALNYQQKEIGRLSGFLAESTPQEALNNAVEDYTAVSERDEIIEDLEDEVKGLRDEIEDLQGTMQLSVDISSRTRQENAKLKELLAHYIGDA